MEFPKVIGRGKDEGREAITVRMSAKDNDVIHLDLKTDEAMSDFEARLAAAYMRGDMAMLDALADELDQA